MNEAFKYDWKRYKKYEYRGIDFVRMLLSKSMLYIYSGRVSASSAGLKKKFWALINNILGRNMCNEIEFKNIGPGLVLMHPYGITVNPEARIGENVTLFKGSTIGSIRSGKVMGTPIIGNRVTICINSTVLGGVKIGDDVLIAAGAFVNFDVPNNSVVVGNPGIIHHKDNPSNDYL